MRCGDIARRSAQASRRAAALRSTIAMMANEGMKHRNAMSDGRNQPPINSKSPIARANDMPRIDPIRATST